MEDDEPIGHFLHVNDLVVLAYVPAGHNEQGRSPGLV